MADVYAISRAMYAEQRQRIAQKLATVCKGSNYAAVLQGSSEIPRNYSDTNFLFRQDSYFEHLFGFEMADCIGCVLSDGKAILCIPRLPESYAVWMGPLRIPSKVIEDTGIENCCYVDELQLVLKEKGVEVVHLLEGINPDSGLPVKTATFPGIENFESNKAILYEHLSNIRVYKTEKELHLLKWLCGVSSRAHIEVMRNCKVGMSQHHLESIFLHHVYYHGGCRQCSYICICATGPSAAILHYPQNNQLLNDGDIALMDMGGEYHCYASDITCSFPVSGKFSEIQRFVYETVLAGQTAVLKKMKPGVMWEEMHKLALHVMCERLISRGLLRGAAVEELMQLEVMQFFQPHGLGHLLGMDVHDVGGYPAGGNTRPARRDCCKLRTTRVLEANMYMTVEPGLYFIPVLLEKAFEDPKFKPFFNEELLRSQFWNFGGVRIEDDVVVTRTGIVNFTCCPRTVEEIESVMAGLPFAKQPEVLNN